MRRARNTLIWLAVLSVASGLVYGIATYSGVPYGEDDIAVVDFTALGEAQKRTALQAANAAPCTCGCGMTLAQCVATDSTCPIRPTNIDKIKAMVERAKGS